MGSVVRGVHVGTDLVAGECLFYFTDSRDQNVEFVTHVMHVASQIQSAIPLAKFWHGLHGSFWATSDKLGSLRVASWDLIILEHGSG